MNKEFIPYEEAFALKELGFDEECLGVYRDKGEELWIDNVNPIEFLLKQDETAIKAPLYQQAFRWLGEYLDKDILMYLSREKQLEQLKILIKLAKEKK